ncbi:uncharacterized protein BDR25DRAFT_359029 [Lindgomyces ingoldianus]|uniref:Uncharacterized protein n=1 Tax=Lindgomyces ingoldianus TaxID=673940 RepID=A0ACB6QLH2_9PLEO|nr:uncharacterized protein BDR25DRAFT_359029 [Lindgomyces ingoldianus]KAF2466970.1 hypothetical protein BDR25DRAFT_359029 [Lindgomyces ingoldianus]
MAFGPNSEDRLLSVYLASIAPLSLVSDDIRIRFPNGWSPNPSKIAVSLHGRFSLDQVFGVPGSFYFLFIYLGLGGIRLTAKACPDLSCTWVVFPLPVWLKVYASEKRPRLISFCEQNKFSRTFCGYGDGDGDKGVKSV